MVDIKVEPLCIDHRKLFGEKPIRNNILMFRNDAVGKMNARTDNNNF